MKKTAVFTLANGDVIPPIGFGTFASDNYDAATVASAVSGAIKCGYRLIDCASVYGNEAEIGAVIEDSIAGGAVTRSELFIQTKVWNDMHGKGDVLLSLAKSLRDLRLDYVDAYYLHWPFPNTHAPGAAPDARDPNSRPFAVDEFIVVWRQLEQCWKLGLARHIGMSNMTISKLEQALPLCVVKPSLIEMEMHPAFQQTELFAYCKRLGVQPIGFCPLGSPKRPARDTFPEDVIDAEMPEIQAIAAAHKIHPYSVCLKWQVQRGAIPIPFSVHEQNYISNLHCLEDDPLTVTEMAQIEKADKGCRLVKGQVFLWPGARGWQDLWD
jgi:alcohol dehydrogenase (NADP+)